MGAARPEPVTEPGRVVSSLTHGGGPTVLRILLGGQLRRLREERGISRDAAGDAIRGSSSKISRMELGRVGFKPRDVADLLTLYGVLDTAEREPLLKLVTEANSPGWWHHFSDVLPPWFEVYLGLEGAASFLRVHETRCVPELLQTREYAHALAVAAHPHDSPAALDRRVDVLTRRQRVLAAADPPQIWAVVDEAALLRPVGAPGVMRRQLHHLLELDRSPAITLQVMPARRSVISVLTGPFTLLRFPEPGLPDVIYVHQLTGALYLDKPADLAVYKKNLDRLSVNADPPKETAATLRRIAAALD